LKDDEVFTQREERSFQGLEVSSPDDEPEIVQTEVLQDLVAICSPDVQLVTWKRTLSAILQAWLEQLDVSCLPYFRILIQPKELRSAMEILLDEGGMPADQTHLHDKWGNQKPFSHSLGQKRLSEPIQTHFRLASY
jgi:hypothetical protein